ncbi:uncharacterized protein [Euphorbia lathyris]|uniref:uncharacterized protein n=1 Tax=Euphorbia lathyris TaxID=212925 RepID=UPI00331438DB
MDTTNSKISISTSSNRPSTRLLFDRRYGWVFDEWKDPSEEALAGGRGMFCILPLAKSFLNTASQSVNLAANFAVKVYERPDLLSPRALQENLHNQLQKFNSTLKKPETSSCLTLKDKFPLQTSASTSDLQLKTGKS